MLTTMTRMNTGWIVGLGLALTLGACRYSSQVIRLHPAPSTSASSAEPVASGQEVVLMTHDVRASREIGRRSSGSDQTSSISTDTDIPALLHRQMTDLLKSKGYLVRSEGPATLPAMDVQLKELSYVAVEGARPRKVSIRVVLETIIKNGSKTYRNTFQAQQERKIVFEPIAKSNEEWINEAFSDALHEVATDSRIYSYLK